MPKIIKNVTNMEIDEISLVDRGANQHALVTIAKRAPNKEDHMPEIELYDEEGTPFEGELEDGDVVYDEDGQAYVFEADESEEEDVDQYESVGKSAGTELVHVAGQGKKFRGTNFLNRQGERAKRAGSKAKSHIGANAPAYAGATGVAAGGGAAFGGHKAKERFGKSYSEQVLEELSKAYSDEDRDKVLSKAFSMVEELEERQQEMEEIAKAERDLRLTREYISKASEYNLPVDPNELGPVMYRMAEVMDYDDCAVIAKCLESAGALIFDEVGVMGGGDNADVMNQVNAFAMEEIGKADAGVITNVFDANPDAYNEYLAQRG